MESVDVEVILSVEVRRRDERNFVSHYARYGDEDHEPAAVSVPLVSGN